MLDGIELFAGAKYEPPFGHVILCGLGGILVEVLNDVSAGLTPLTMKEAHSMIESLKGSKIFGGYTGPGGYQQRSLCGYTCQALHHS